MARKLIVVGIFLVGLFIALNSNAWAGHGKHAKRHAHYGHPYHHGHPYHWAKGQRHHRPHRYRHHRAGRHRGHAQPVVVEKHVYHNYYSDAPEPVIEEEGFRFAFSVADEAYGVSVEVSHTD